MCSLGWYSDPGVAVGTVQQCTLAERGHGAEKNIQCSHINILTIFPLRVDAQKVTIIGEPDVPATTAQTVDPRP